LAESCTPNARVGEYTQAIMDLGATVCTRARPACTVCPFVAHCVAAAEGRQGELPGRKARRARAARETTLLIAESESSGARAVLISRRPAAGIWGGLWSPPEFASADAALDWCRREIGGLLAESEALEPIDHAFTHFDLRLHPVRVRVRECDCGGFIGGVRDGGDQWSWFSLSSPPRVGLPQPIRALFERLLHAE
jgi:A/G-specific adenine glycosylase